MSKLDAINGCFEFAGGAMLWANVVALVRDKRVRGTSRKAQALFTLWGLWNLIYYPALHQWWSLLGGLQVVAANGAWLWLAHKYRNG